MNKKLKKGYIARKVSPRDKKVRRLKETLQSPIRSLRENHRSMAVTWKNVRKG